MKRKILMLVPAVMLAAGTFARPAAAAPNECIDGCNADFPGGDPITISARGWCYILRGCWAEET